MSTSSSSLWATSLFSGPHVHCQADLILMPPRVGQCDGGMSHDHHIHSIDHRKETIVDAVSDGLIMGKSATTASSKSPRSSDQVTGKQPMEFLSLWPAVSS